MKKPVMMLLLFPLTAHAGWFGSYEDCIFENIKPGMNNRAVYVVTTACRNKYPLPKLNSDRNNYPLPKLNSEMQPIKCTPENPPNGLLQLDFSEELGIPPPCKKQRY